MANDLRNGRPIPLVMGRRLFLIGASALALSACGGIVGPPDAPQIYVLKPAAPATTPAAAKVDWALSVQIPAASTSLDTQRIALTHSDTTLDYYANAVWPDALPMLVQTAVLAGLQGSGRITAVSREQEALHADYTLSLDIRDFAAHYSDPKSAPKVSVIIIAQIATAHGRLVVDNLTATQSAQAAANSVDAVVQAMNTALNAAVAQLTDWALNHPAPPSPAPTTPERSTPAGRLVPPQPRP